MKKHVGVIFFLILLLPEILLGQLEIKRGILDDCRGALEEIGKLDQPQRCELVSYLQLVLKRTPDQAQATTGTGVTSGGFAPPPGSAAGFAAGEFLRSLDPQREEEAKGCAVKALLLVDSCAFEALPELVELAQKPGVSMELAKQSREAAVEIAHNAASAQATVSAEVFARLVDLLRQDPGEPVRYVLSVFGEKAIPGLFAGLQRPGESERDNVARLLISIDKEGLHVGPPLFEILKTADDSLRSRAVLMLAELKPLYPQSAAELIRILSAASTEVRTVFLGGLRKIFEQSHGGEIRLDPDTLKLFVEMLLRSDPAEQAVFCLGLNPIAAASPEIVPDLTALLSNTSEDLRVCAVLALGHAARLSDAEFAKLQMQLYDKSARVQLVAVQALGLRKERKEKILTLFAQLLKSTQKQKDPGTKERLAEAVARAVLSLDTESPALSSFFVQYLGGTAPGGNGNGQGAALETPVVTAISRTGRSAAPFVLKALKDSNPLVRKRAVFALGGMRDLEERSAAALIEVLVDKDEAVRAETRSALVKAGALAVPALRKTLARKAKEIRFAAANVLLDLQVIDDPRFGPALLEGLKEASCEDKAAALIKLPGEALKLKQGLSELLSDCLHEAGRLDPSTREAVQKAIVSS